MGDSLFVLRVVQGVVTARMIKIVTMYGTKLSALPHSWPSVSPR